MRDRYRKERLQDKKKSGAEGGERKKWKSISTLNFLDPFWVRCSLLARSHIQVSAHIIQSSREKKDHWEGETAHKSYMRANVHAAPG